MHSFRVKNRRPAATTVTTSSRDSIDRRQFHLRIICKHLITIRKKWSAIIRQRQQQFRIGITEKCLLDTIISGLLNGSQGYIVANAISWHLPPPPGCFSFLFSAPEQRERFLSVVSCEWMNVRSPIVDKNQRDSWRESCRDWLKALIK